MSELRDQVLDAIDGGARDRAAIIEQTGLEHRQVGNLLFNLKAAGQIVRTDEGWTRADGAPPPARRVHLAPEPEQRVEDVPPARAKRKVKTNGAAVPVPVHPGNGAQPEPVAFARFGEYVVLRTSDLANLAELVRQLERWRPIVDLAR